jgi:hypothetical protein
VLPWLVSYHQLGWILGEAISEVKPFGFPPIQGLSLCGEVFHTRKLGFVSFHPKPTAVDLVVLDQITFTNVIIGFLQVLGSQSPAPFASAKNTILIHPHEAPSRVPPVVIGKVRLPRMRDASNVLLHVILHVVGLETRALQNLADLGPHLVPRLAHSREQEAFQRLDVIGERLGRPTSVMTFAHGLLDGTIVELDVLVILLFAHPKFVLVGAFVLLSVPSPATRTLGHYTVHVLSHDCSSCSPEDVRAYQ